MKSESKTESDTKECLLHCNSHHSHATTPLLSTCVSVCCVFKNILLLFWQKQTNPKTINISYNFRKDIQSVFLEAEKQYLLTIYEVLQFLVQNQ